MTRQPFHLVEYSPSPLTGAIDALMLTAGLTSWSRLHTITSLLLVLIIIIIIMIQWWRGIIQESAFMEFYTSQVMTELWWSMILFI